MGQDQCSSESKNEKKTSKRAGNGSNNMVGKTIKPGSCRTTRQGNPIQADYSTNDNSDKIEHSKLLTLVFEEAEELIRERWHVLNDLATSKSQSIK